MFLDENDQARLNKINSIPLDKTRQEVYGNFIDFIYDKYKIDKKRFFSISTYPVFGKIVVDNKRVRLVEVKKISKSDQ